MPTLADVPTAKFQALTRLVGNTPLVAIHFRLEGKHRVLYAKSEYLNLTGSIKDRMAVRILHQAYTDGKITPGHTIAEATSGNTGISFAAIGRMLGHPVKIFMPDWMSQERVHLIRSYGLKSSRYRRTKADFSAASGAAKNWPLRLAASFSPGNFQIPQTRTRIRKPPARKSGRNSSPLASARELSWPASVPAARSWELENSFGNAMPPSACTLWSLQNPPRSPRVAKWAITAFRESPTSSFRKSSASRNSTKFFPFPMAMPS